MKMTKANTQKSSATLRLQSIRVTLTNQSLTSASSILPTPEFFLRPHLSLGHCLLEFLHADLVAEPRRLEVQHHVVQVPHEKPLKELGHPDRILAGDPADLGERLGQVMAIALPGGAVQRLRPHAGSERWGKNVEFPWSTLQLRLTKIGSELNRQHKQ